MAERIHHIWYPLFDQPVTLTLSREQLQCVQDALLGKRECVTGWNVHFAAEIENVLKESNAKEAASD